MASFGNIGGSLGTKAIFAGIGAAEGVAENRLHSQHLEEAMDMSHKTIWDKENADATLDKAKTEDELRKEQTLRGDQSPDVIKTNQARYGTPDQQVQQAAPGMMPPNAGQPQPQGQQPTPMPMPQGQAPQGQQPAPQQQQAPIQPRTQPIQAPQGATQLASNVQLEGQQNPPGRAEPQPTQPAQTPPPVGDRATNAPSEKLAMATAVQKAAQTQDPFDINYAKAGIVVNENTGEHHWVQENADNYKLLHDLYPNLSDDQRMALVADKASGNWHGTNNMTARQSWLDHAAKLDGQAAKYEGGPINIKDLGDNDKQYIAARQAAGLTTPTNLQPLRPGEERMSDQVMEKAANAKQAAQSGINSMNTMLSTMGVDNAFGPMAATTTKMKTWLANASDQQVSQAVDNWWIQNKNTILAGNNNLRSVPGGRMGVGFLNREIEGVPSAVMSPNAEREMIMQYFTNYRQAANYSDALMDGPEKYTTASQRIDYANAYMKSNPAFDTTGLKPNEAFKEYGDWKAGLAGGGGQQGPTESDIRKESATTMSAPQTTDNKTIAPQGQGTPNSTIPVTKGKDGSVKFDFSGF